MASEAVSGRKEDEPRGGGGRVSLTLAAERAAGGGSGGSAAVRRRFTTHQLQTSGAAGHGHTLCWGWMLKQGAGGLLHSKKWKRRFFVLFRVPQGHVLVYYSRASVSVDELMGFVDLRTATEVDSDVCMINKQPRRVIEVVTPERTFVLAPETLNKVRGAVACHMALPDLTHAR